MVVRLEQHAMEEIRYTRKKLVSPVTSHNSLSEVSGFNEARTSLWINFAFHTLNIRGVYNTAIYQKNNTVLLTRTQFCLVDIKCRNLRHKHFIHYFEVSLVVRPQEIPRWWQKIGKVSRKILVPGNWFLIDVQLSINSGWPAGSTRNRAALLLFRQRDNSTHCSGALSRSKRFVDYSLRVGLV